MLVAQLKTQAIITKIQSDCFKQFPTKAFNLAFSYGNKFVG